MAVAITIAQRYASQIQIPGVCLREKLQIPNQFSLDDCGLDNCGLDNNGATICLIKHEGDTRCLNVEEHFGTIGGETTTSKL